MSIIIEGPAFPLDELNANDWGVPKSEAQNAIDSLKKSVIRICPRFDAHICDLFEDPFLEIGRIIDAWEQDGSIWAKGIITDSVAEQKISDGTWEKNWSVFGYEESNTEGFSQGFEARSMTLVRNPAWDSATWAIVAAKDAGAKNRTAIVTASNVFTIFNISNSTKTKTKKSACSRKGDSMADNPEPDIKAILERLDALEKATANPADAEEEGTAEAVTASIRQISASLKALDTSLQEKEKRIASLEKELSTAIPAEKFPEMLTAALSEEKEKDKRAAAYSKFAAVRKERGLETKEEDYKAMTAADFERSTSELETLRPVAAGAQYPQSGGAVQAGANTGIFDPYTKTWKEG